MGMTAPQLRDATRDVLGPLIGSWNDEVRHPFISISNAHNTLWGLIHQECLARWPDDAEKREAVVGYLEQRLIAENGNNSVAGVGASLNHLREEIPREEPERNLLTIISNADAHADPALVNAERYLNTPRTASPLSNVRVPEHPAISSDQTEQVSFLRMVAESDTLFTPGTMVQPTIRQLQEQLELAGFETGSLGADGQVGRKVINGTDGDDGPATRAARAAAHVELGAAGVTLSDSQLYQLLLAHNDRLDRKTHKDITPGRS